MMADFRRIFFPTPEEEKKDFERVARLYFSNIGYCCTCANHDESEMPGFVTDYGECRLNVPDFPEKACAQVEANCEKYELDEEQVEYLLEAYRDILKKVKGPQVKEEKKGKQKLPEHLQEAYDDLLSFLKEGGRE